jgi:tetratricopeptide (TPR) repeat protein
LIPGSRIGSYEIVALLGAGGMGEVYRARDRKLGREVAIKVLPESVAADPAALARFEREAKAVAALLHTNILSIFDFGMHDGVSYAVMELLEGETLRGKLNAGPIPQKQAVDYALQIAKGLSAAHTRALEINPQGEWASHYLGITALLEGKPEEAKAIVAPAITALRISIVALAEHDLGHPRESQQALDNLISKFGQTACYQIAKVYARRGELNKAFEWLDRALEQKDSQPATLMIDPIIAPLRNDRRYTEMLKKPNLPGGTITDTL